MEFAHALMSERGEVLATSKQREKTVLLSSRLSAGSADGALGLLQVRRACAAAGSKEKREEAALEKRGRKSGAEADRQGRENQSSQRNRPDSSRQDALAKRGRQGQASNDARRGCVYTVHESKAQSHVRSFFLLFLSDKSKRSR